VRWSKSALANVNVMAVMVSNFGAPHATSENLNKDEA